MISLQRALTAFFISFQLVACGGGGGGSSDSSSEVTQPTTFSTKSSADSHYVGLAEDAYQGVSSSANLDESSLLNFASFIIGTEDESDASVPVIASASDEKLPISPKTISLLRAQSPVSEVKRLAGAKTSPKDNGVLVTASSIDEELIDVDDLIDCYSGSVRYTGELDQHGIGVLNVSFNNCEYDGVTISGTGHISYESQYSDDYTWYYNGVRTSFGGEVSIWNGYVDHTVGSNGEYTSLRNLTISDVASGEQIRYHNYFDSFDPSTGEVNISGQLYMSEIGYISLVTDSPLVFNGSEFVAGRLSFDAQTTNGEVYFQSSSAIILSLDEDNNGDFEAGVLLTSTSDLEADNLEELSFVAHEDINIPPSVTSLSLIFNNYVYVTTATLSVDEFVISDPEGDSAEVLEYQWSINGQYALSTNDGTFPSGTAFYGDTVSVQLLITDGHNQVISGFDSVYVNDAPSVFTVTGVDAVEILAPGDVLSFSAGVFDPDTPNQMTPATLKNVPSGMTIDENGNVSWVAPEPSLWGLASYDIELANPFNEYEKYTVQLTVKSSNVDLPLARSGISVPSSNHSMIIGNFDGIEGNEILTTDSRSRVMLVERDGSDFQQKWMYPLAMPTLGNIVQVQAENLDSDESLEIIVATESGISILSELDSFANVVKLLDSETVVAIAVGQLDISSDPVLVMLKEMDSGGKALEVIELDGLTTLRNLSVSNDAREVVLGNVDNDAAIEIITNDGYVYDGSTFANQWFYASGYGAFIDVGDVDNDGVDEIFGATSWDDVALFDAVAKEQTWSKDNFNTCSVIVENIDDDPQEELVIGDCQWGNIHAYDLSSGVEVFDGLWDMYDHGSKSLVYGDSDNDGDQELHWGTGQSSSGEDYLVAADNDGVRTHTPGELNGFISLGVSKVNDIEKSIFIVTATDSGYSGPMIAMLNSEGEIDLSSGYGRLISGTMTDYDGDGSKELFANIDSVFYNGSLKLIDLDSGSTKWEINSSQGNSYRHMGVIDLNNDDVKDLVYASDGAIEVVDIVNETLLTTISLERAVGYSDLITDVNGDGRSDIIMTDLQSVKVYIQSGGSFNLVSTINADCELLEAIQLDNDSGSEIACLSNTWSNGTLRTYDFNGSYLSQQNSFDLDFEVKDFVTDPDDPSTVYLGIDTSGSYHYSRSKIIAFSLIDGTSTWSTPELIGVPKRDAIQIRSNEEANGGPRITIGTTHAMYLID